MQKKWDVNGCYYNKDLEEDIKILELTMEDSKDYGQYCLTRIELDAIENLIKRI